MSHLESVIASSDDLLKKGFHYAGSQTSSYITSRSNASFVPNTASDFKPSSSRLSRFQPAQGLGWMDSGTCRLLFRITNLSPTATLIPISDSPGSMFRSLRIVASGSSELERIDDYGGTHQLMSELLPAARRSNDIIESWGGTKATCTLSLSLP